jgi:formylglycine-generating enzyme required for sulfatase activity
MRAVTLTLLAALFLLAQDRTIAPLGSGGRRVALVIGNDSYAALDRLSNARNDARAMSDALRAAGFQVTTVTDAKMEDMDRGVNTFVRSIQPRDVALFYYSGHAAEIDGQNLLIPIDLAADLDEIQVKNRSLHASEVLERMEARGAALQIVVLDACRTNPFRSMRGVGAGGLASMAAGRGTFIAYASAPGKPASDNPRAGNGLFTSYLIEALRTPGLELQRVFARAGEGTEDASGGRQVPWISHSVRGEFYFLASNSPNVRPPVVATDSSPRPVQVRVNAKDGQRYVWIPPGKFMMGCSPGDDKCPESQKPAHSVQITKGFWIGQTSVTVGAWKRYRAATGKPALPTEDGHGGTNLNEAGGNDNMPAVAVLWEEARDFCEWSGGRLPTEAEYEYAARAGSTEKLYGNPEAVSWYAGNSGKQKIDIATLGGGRGASAALLTQNGNAAHPVGLKAPNIWGLYDMVGNVLAWASDWYDPKYYDRQDNVDPIGPPNGAQRVLRGGGWSGTDPRASFRNGWALDNRNDRIGVRCAAN